MRGIERQRLARGRRGWPVRPAAGHGPGRRLLVGDGIWKPEVKGRALRDMLNPGTAYNDSAIGKDPQPAHMKDFVNTTRDNGGVHDGIDFGRLKHLDDQWVPDVCAHELRAREFHAWRLEVDAEDLTDVGILL